MKNLKLLNICDYTLSNISGVEGCCRSGDTCFLYSKGCIYQVAGNQHTILFNTELLSPIVCFSFHYEKNGLVLCYASGDIVFISLDDLSTTTVFNFGAICATAWSPEQEYFVVVSNNTVILMTSDFDPLLEVDLHKHSFGESAFINVGWGKKETQFHGSEGKAAAKVKINTNNEHPRYDDQQIKISWRNDGEFFAISCLRPDTQRYIRIFDKEGALQSTSEDIVGLESPLHWYSSKLMASSQRFPNKHVICFIEKNGLKHGEFNLPFTHSQVRVNEVLWNEDGKLLAVFSEELENTSVLETNATPSPGDKYIQCFTRGNYHWYCKYTITLNKTDKVISLDWDSRQNNVLYVLFERDGNVHYLSYLWTWYIDQSTATEKMVSVVDGKQLLLTSFSRGIVPPPMSTCSITSSSPINTCTFPSLSDGLYSYNDVLLQQSNNLFRFYKYYLNKENIISFELQKEVKLSFGNDVMVSHFVWVNSTIYCASYMLGKPVLCSFSLESEEWSLTKLMDLDSPIYWIKKCANIDQLYIQQQSGHSFNVHINDFTNKIEKYKTNGKYFTNLDISREGQYVIALDLSNKLYMNGNVVANNVTSFLIHGKFLLLTTLEHRLLCLRLDADLTKAFEGSLSEFSSRRIERGSRLVSSVHIDSKVVLQMPRGNLECIQPRALSLYIIGEYLDNKQYFEAFDIMRKQRINLNLIHDHNPILLSNSISKFIDDLKDNPSWISLFLSELSEENVTETMYAALYPNKVAWFPPKEGKVAFVCHYVSLALKNYQNAETLILPLLTCHIKMGKTEDIERALNEIKKIKEIELNGTQLGVSADEALNYMLYLIDVEELFKIALGMYDFDLVLLVVKKSQKDPKEYLPFINELRKLEPNYQKFTIDKHLKRYEKAVAHILQCQDKFTECLQFIKTHKLFGPALKAIKEPDCHESRMVFYEYGNDLLMSRKYEEAGVMFTCSGDYQNAMKAYQRTTNWREVIRCTRKLQLDKEEAQAICLSLITNLKQAKMYEDAAKIYLDYMKDVETGVECLCLGQLFAEAIRISELHGNTDLLTSINGHTVMYADDLIHEIHVRRRSFEEQKRRLAVVREKKLQNPVSEVMNEEQDMYSETSTIRTSSYAGSKVSNRSYKSAKNKRKQERKMLSLKEGGQYEDLALVASLHQHVTYFFELKPLVRELNKILFQLSGKCIAKQIQELYSEVLLEVQSSLSEIWTPDLLSTEASYGPEATANQIADSFLKGLQNNSSSAGLDLRLKIPPKCNDIGPWEFDLLKYID